MWIIKHAPKKLSEFVGNNTVVSQLMSYNFRKPLLLYGPSGCGKTLLVNLLAQEKGWDIVSVSDENLESAKLMSQTTSLFGDRRLIVLDDIALMKDMKACEEILKEARNPTIAVTSDLSSKRLKTVKQLCEGVGLRRPHPASIVKHLKDICEKEGVNVPSSVLEGVAKNVEGDVRSAVNDLQTLAQGRKKLGESDLDLLYERDKKKDVYAFLSRVYGGKDVYNIVQESMDLDEQPESILFWIDENVARVYGGGKRVCDALEFLSKADVFLGRITRRQYWGFLRYATPLMSGGVAVSRPQKISYSRYMFPSFYGMLGRTKKERSLRKSIGVKAGPRLHISSKIFDKQYIGLYKTLIKKKKADPEEIKEFFYLTDEEIEYLLS